MYVTFVEKTSEIVRKSDLLAVFLQTDKRLDLAFFSDRLRRHVVDANRNTDDSRADCWGRTEKDDGYYSAKTTMHRVGVVEDGGGRMEGTARGGRAGVSGAVEDVMMSGGAECGLGSKEAFADVSEVLQLATEMLPGYQRLLAARAWCVMCVFVLCVWFVTFVF